MKKIKDIIELDDGFFKVLEPAPGGTNPIILDYFNSLDLDMDFFSRYGNKAISPLVDNLLDSTGELSDANRLKISGLIYRRNYHKYKELLQVLDIIEDNPWNPTENYSLEVEGEDKTTYGKTDTLTHSGSEKDQTGGTDTLAFSGKEKTTEGGSDTLSKSGSETYTHETTTGGNTVTTENKKNTFNSASAVNTDSSTVTKEEDTTDTTSFTNRQDATTYGHTEEVEFTNRQDATTFGKYSEKTFTNRQDTNVGSGTDKVEHSRSEHGSLGVSSAIDQVVRNVEGFKLVDLYDMILEDFNKVLTLPIYFEED